MKRQEALAQNRRLTLDDLEDNWDHDTVSKAPHLAFLPVFHE